jgi:predicted nicotinamide N-methyase
VADALIAPSMDRIAGEAFIRANTVLRPVPFVEELSLYLADRPYDIWQLAKEARGGELGLPLPYWAFAWAGGQALARYVLDHPETVRDKRVLDLASGSGLVAIAAARAGATQAIANDIEPFAAAAMAVNAAANSVRVHELLDDLLDGDADTEVILAADFCYERPFAERAMAFLERAHARGVAVLVGDPERRYFPRERFEPIAAYEVPVPFELEETEVKRTTVWRLR